METKFNPAAMLIALANLPTDAAAIALFQEKHPGFIPEPQGIRHTVTLRSEAGEAVPTDLPENLHHVLMLQSLVRQLWKGNPDARTLSDLEQVLLSGRLGIGNVPFLKSFNPQPLTGIIGIDWKHRTFVYRPQTLLQQALHYLMQESRRAKICANPDCPHHPYFLAGRSNAQYCSDDCLQATLRASKRTWWDEHGTEWRKNREKESKRPRRKK